MFSDTSNRFSAKLISGLARGAGAGLILASFLFPISNLMGQEANLRVGPLEMDLTGHAALVYDSNVGYSAIDPEHDFIFRVGLDLRGTWEITSYNQLRLGIGATYEKYVRNPELDSSRNFLRLSPDTELAFAVRVGEVEIVVFDRLQFATSASDIRLAGGTTGDLLAFNRFENTIGFNGVWELDPYWRLTFGADRFDMIPWDNDIYEFVRRTENTLRLGAQHDLAANMSVGIGGTISRNSYAEDFQRDSSGRSISANIAWEPTALIQTSAAVGWSWIDFDSAGNNQDFNDTSSVFGSLRIAHTVNRFLNHDVQASRSISYGYVSNTVLADTVRYSLMFLGIRRTQTVGTIQWSRGRESGGFAPERYDRWNYGLQLTYSIAQNMRCSLTYDYEQKSSNVLDRSYDRHEVGLRFSYDF